MMRWYEWVFSGIGAAAILFIANQLVHWLLERRREVEPTAGVASVTNSKARGNIVARGDSIAQVVESESADGSIRAETYGGDNPKKA